MSAEKYTIGILNNGSLVELQPKVNPQSLQDIAATITNNEWTPSTFNNNYRNRANFQSCALLVLDIDGGHTLDEAKETFKGYQHIIATTRSHQKEKHGVTCDRFRVIIPLSSPITDAKTYSATWHHYAARWPFIDKACKDESRLYYRSTAIIEVVTTGTTAPVIEPTLTVAEQVERRQHLRALPDPGSKGKLSHATLTFLLEGAPKGEWNVALFKVAKDMHEQGYTREEAIEKLGNMKHGNFSGTLDEADMATIDSAYKFDPKYDKRSAFPHLLTTKGGLVIIDPYHIENIKHLITNELGWTVRFNTLKQRITVKRSPNKPKENITDYHLSLIVAAADEWGIRAGKEKYNDALVLLAQEQQYHPAKEFIESRPWDSSTDYIGALFNTFTLEPPDIGDEISVEESLQHYRNIFKKWFICAVAKIYQPGTQGVVLVLQGDQGLGKSTWLEKLAMGERETWVNAAIHPDRADDQIKLLEHNIWIIDEIDAVTRKRDIAELKAFLTTTEVNARRPYARHADIGYTQCSFAASVNSTDFLYDETGNRRFAVFPTTFFVFEHGVPMQQVYAQAKALLDAGETHQLNREELAFINTTNNSYQAEDWTHQLAARIQPGEDKLTGMEILNIAGVSQPDHRGVSILGKVLKKLGIKRTQKRYENGLKLRVYCINKAALLAVKDETLPRI